MYNSIFRKSLRKNFSVYRKRLVTDTKDVNLKSAFIEPSNDKITKNLVLLHGLFGNSNNWRMISYNEAIRNRRRSVLIDLRNHGDADHHHSMTYPEMADDVIRHLDRLKIEKFTLLGHSMGGKVAMHLSIKYPERLDGLLVVDSAPKSHLDNKNIYGNTFEIVNKVSGMTVEGKTRKEVLTEFQYIMKGAVANLLNMNLSYVSPDSDKVQWRCNIKSISNNMERIMGFDSTDGRTYGGPLAVIVGEKSYIFPLEVYERLFPHIKSDDMKVVNAAGHWVHVDQPTKVIRNIVDFLDKIDQNN